MKKTIGIVGAAIAILGGAVGCGSDQSVATEGVAEPATQESQDALVWTTPGVGIWTAGPVLLDGCTASTQFLINSSAALDFIALDLAPIADLSLTISGIGLDGAIIPYPNLYPTVISPALIDTITPLLGTYPYVGGYPYAAGTGLATATALDTAWVGFGPTWSALGMTPITMPMSSLLLSPAITTNALVFTGLPLMTNLTGFVINATFPAAQAATVAQMNIFAAQAGADLALSTALFPLPLMGCGAPIVSPAVPIVF